MHLKITHNNNNHSITTTSKEQIQLWEHQMSLALIIHTPIPTKEYPTTAMVCDMIIF
jgi:hypothetical protein